MHGENERKKEKEREREKKEKFSLKSKQLDARSINNRANTAINFHNIRFNVHSLLYY